MATNVTAGLKIAKDIVLEGDARDQNGGSHLLVGVDPGLISSTLVVASKKGSEYFWAVICVLLRLRFGEFVYFERASSKLLTLRSDVKDDVELAVSGIRKFLLVPNVSNISKLSDLFNSKNGRSLNATAFKSMTEAGFSDQIGISILCFLRDHQSDLPASLGKEPDMTEVKQILLPLFWEVFGVPFGAFVTGDNSVSKVINSKISGSDYEIAAESCLKTGAPSLVLGHIEENSRNEKQLVFGVVIGHNVEAAVLKLTSSPNFSQLFLEATAKKPVHEVIIAQVEPPAEKVIRKLQPLETFQTTEQLVAAALAAVNKLQSNLKATTASLAEAESKLKNTQRLETIEVERHKANMEMILGSRHDLDSDVSRLRNLSAEIRASLEKLGIDPLN